MAFLAAKSGGDLEKALVHKFNHVTLWNDTDLQIRSQKPRTVMARLH